MSAYPWNGRLSFSLLKYMALSPAHFLAACTAERETTPAMRRGTLVHWYALGGPPERAPRIGPEGTRATKAWKEWAAAQPPGVDLFTTSEAEEAQEVARAAASAPHNAPLWREWIDGAETEVPMEWEMNGIPMATRGIDVLHRGRGLIVDLKTAASSEPFAFGRDARKRHYGVQLACYQAACEQNGILIHDRALYVVESSPPYVATVFRHPEAARAADLVTLLGWLAALRACLESNRWPGYSATHVDLDASYAAVAGEDGLSEASE